MCDLQQYEHFIFNLDLKNNKRISSITLFALLTAFPSTFHFVHHVQLLCSAKLSLPQQCVDEIMYGMERLTNQLQVWYERKCFSRGTHRKLNNKQLCCNVSRTFHLTKHFENVFLPYNHLFVRIWLPGSQQWKDDSGLSQRLCLRKGLNNKNINCCILFPILFIIPVQLVHSRGNH